ncbi:unnamed protein product [Tilletia controversa]|uniref:Uncharacterized protein n=4 Tax=Tilletia TaxID=13289 RepID=A0A8X7MSQ9_9BASI|nr:hypothetical protein CF336_g2937 [Tilletia laevis]KAE8196782.1 hypothetical protein CF328_g4042 [Tilletia controversa]KAE8260425.1 hypothetical protein A4X03_0g3828 [Tilletia caries]KAE8202155.1 hypothetical protein CF335_g3525 [Tilletia laevis]KAE8246977.1 hypothetical protein A4X06_0g4787 [Tilletia controversa]
MLKQSQLVADHYDLPFGCASSICFYLANDWPFSVPTSMSASAWPLAFDSFHSSGPSKTDMDQFPSPISLPLPPTATQTGLPICANLCFDFGAEEAYGDADSESDSASRAAMPARQSAPAYWRSPSWERRSSFQQMPYANLENSPSPRKGRLSSGSTLSPATRRMRTFAFNAELRRRGSTSAASPCFTSSMSRLVGPPSVVPAAKPAALADFLHQQQQHSYGRMDMESPKTNLLPKVMSTPSDVHEDDGEDEDSDEKEDYVDTHSERSESVSSMSIATFGRSQSSLFSSTQGTTVWNEDDAVFEDARPQSWTGEGEQPTPHRKRHSRLESNRGLPMAHHAAIIDATMPFWSIAGPGSILTPSTLSPSGAEAEEEAEELRTAQVHSRATRVVDVTTAKMMSPLTATTAVGRGRAYTCFERSSQSVDSGQRDVYIPWGKGSTLDGAVTPNANAHANAGPSTKNVADPSTATAMTGLGLGPPSGLAPPPVAVVLPLKTVIVPIINRSPANGTLARRRALTMLNQPSTSSSVSTCTPNSKDVGANLSVGR